MLVFGLPDWLVATVALGEMATAAAMVASDWAYLAALVLAGGAILVHALRQGEVVAAIPAIGEAAVSVAGVAISEDANLAGSVLALAVTSLCAGAAGAWAVSAAFGSTPRPTEFVRAMAVAAEADRLTKGAREVQKRDRRDVRKGSKAL